MNGTNYTPNFKLEKLKRLDSGISDTALSPKHISKVPVKKSSSKLKDLSDEEYKKALTLLFNSNSALSISSKSNTNITANTTIEQLSRAASFNLPNVNPVKLAKEKPVGLRLAISPQNEPMEKASNTHRKSPRLLVPLSNPSKPTNFVKKVCYKSRNGTINGVKRIKNQNCIIVKPKLHNVKGNYLFGVCSGHGAQGNTLSEYAKESILTSIELLLPVNPTTEDTQRVLKSLIERVSESLSDSNIEIRFSGCTVLTVLIIGNKCICANLGDCKAVIGKEQDSWESFLLSSDHSLRNKKERKRMIANNARIAYESKENRVEKFYMGNEDVPGLDITRSIGDKIGKFIGMLSSPDVLVHAVKPCDRFIIIGTRGFWKVMAEIEAVCIVRFTLQNGIEDTACNELIKEAERRWAEQARDRDDLTVMVIYLNTISN